MVRYQTAADHKPVQFRPQFTFNPSPPLLPEAADCLGRDRNRPVFIPEERMNTRTQCDRVICHLATGKPITPIAALNRWGVFRLAARISDLRKDGHKIKTERVTRRGKTFAEYRLAH